MSGPASSTVSTSAVRPLKSGTRTSIAVAGLRRRTARIVAAHTAAPAVGQLVPGDARDDAVPQAHRGHRLGDAGGLAQVELGRAPGLDRAEIARARADVAQDHHGRRAPRPAFAQVRALGALADRMELVAVHKAPHGVVGRSVGQLGPQPRGFAGGVHRRHRLRIGSMKWTRTPANHKQGSPRKFPFAPWAPVRQVDPLT